MIKHFTAQKFFLRCISPPYTYEIDNILNPNLDREILENEYLQNTKGKDKIPEKSIFNFWLQIWCPYKVIAKPLARKVFGPFLTKIPNNIEEALTYLSTIKCFSIENMFRNNEFYKSLDVYIVIQKDINILYKLLCAEKDRNAR